MDSLYDEIETSGQKMLPPFAETIVLITLCWHSVAFQRAAHGGKTSPSDGDTWKRHTRLYQMVQQRLMLVSLPPSSPELHDPMRLFTNMLANAAVIWFYNIMEALQVETGDEIILVPLYSAYEIVGLAKPLTRSSFFKVRPFPFLPVDWRWFWCLTLFHRRMRFLPCYSISRQSFSRHIPIN